MILPSILYTKECTIDCIKFVQCEYNHKVESPPTSEILVNNKVCLSDFSGYSFDESIISNKKQWRNSTGWIILQPWTGPKYHEKRLAKDPT